MSAFDIPAPKYPTKPGACVAYPGGCLSSCCGKTSCEGCPSRLVLAAFKAWVKKTGARCKDPIWCPTIYEVPDPKADALVAQLNAVAPPGPDTPDYISPMRKER